MCERAEGRKAQWQSSGHVGCSGISLGDEHNCIGLWEH